MKFVIYARKSTESEDRQALSIQSQIIEMKEVAKRENIKIVDILQESKSAKKPGRPIFDEMIRRLESGDYDGILCWKIDRLARNPVDEGIIKWLLQNEKIKQIKTFDRDYNPEDNVVIASIEFSMANQYIRDLSKNVKRGQAEKIRRGEYPANPPLGYLMDYKTKKIYLDKERWKYIKDAFRLYSRGDCTLPVLEKELYNKGFRSRKNKRVYRGAIYKILKNPIYYGWFRWNGQIYRGIHKPIVSKKLFDEVQEVFEPRKNTSSRNIHEFLFRGFLTCGECGLKITAEKQKGHTYYRCTKSKGTKKCSQKYLREENLVEEIDNQLKKLKIDEDAIDLMVEAAKESSQDEWNNARRIEKRNQALLDSNKERQDSLIEKFIDNAIPEDIYNRKLAELRNDEATLEENLRVSKDKFCNVFEKIEQSALFIKKAHGIFAKGDLEVKKEVASVLTSNISIKDKKISKFQLAEPFCWVMDDIEMSKGKDDQNNHLRTEDFALDKTKTAPSRETVFEMHGM